MTDILSIDQIRANCPNQWVLVGNPALDNETTLGSITNKLVAGVVLLASKDKREIGYKSKETRVGFESVACIYTGEIPQNRKWLL